MKTKKNALIDRNNDQRKLFILTIFFTTSFLVLSGFSFYDVVYGQNPNSSTSVDDNITSTFNNSKASLKETNAGGLGESQDYSSSLPDLFNYVKKSVVQITDPEDLQQKSEIAGSRLGSGFVYDKEGHIVTNYHVVAGA
ncbi:MAG: serine protease, partial [Nitrosopumilus sp.]|nr:serine protease [Nitrosopumilus sp.]